MNRHAENALIVTALLSMLALGVLMEASHDVGVGPAQDGPVCPAPALEGGR